MKPQISIIMAVYNEENTVIQTINSILNQTYKNFEFIIINDGSTDKTIEILNNFSDKRLKIINQKNIGLTRSLNKGIEASKGEYIARQDAGDLSHPSRLSKQVKVFEEDDEVGVVTSWYVFLDKDRKRVGYKKIPTDSKKIEHLLFKENPIVHGSVMMKRELLEKVGFYREEFECAQDVDLWLRMTEHAKFHIVPEYLYNFRLTPESIGTEKVKIQRSYGNAARECALARKLGQDEKIIIKKTGGLKKAFNKQSDRFGKAMYLTKLGGIKLRNGNLKESRKDLMYSLRIYPFSYKTWAKLFLTFMPSRIRSSTLW